MSATISQLAILFIFILCGFALGRIKKISIEKSNILSVLLVNIFLPCKIFSNFSKRCTLPYLKSNYRTFLVSITILLLLVLFSLGVSKLLTKNAYERRIFRYSFAISNYAYLGYVFVESSLGEQALTDMILFCIPFAFYTYTFGYMLLTTTDSEPGSKQKLFKKLINPMVISLALGMIFGILEIPLPSVLTTALGLASECVGPLSMILTGIVIASFSLKEILPNAKTLIFTAIRLVIIPALLFGVSTLLGHFGLLPDAVYPAVVIMGCMPCGLNTIVFPMLVGEDCKTGARFVLFSHIACLITIPLWMWILV